MNPAAKWIMFVSLVAWLAEVDCINKSKRNKAVMPHATKCFKKYQPPPDMWEEYDFMSDVWRITKCPHIEHLLEKPDDVKRAMSGDCMKSQQGKLLMFCTLEDMGLVNKDGTGNMDKVKKFLAVISNNQSERKKLEKSAEECNKMAAALKPMKIEDKVTELCNCLHDAGAF